MNNCLNEHLLKTTVTNIKWERVTVYVDVKLEYKDSSLRSLPLDFYAVNGLYDAKAFFEVEQLEEDKVRLSVNVTNPGDCFCLRMGTYSIMACQGDNILARCTVDPSIVPIIDNFSRSFLHNNRTKSYIVNFYVAEDQDDLNLVMYVMDTTKENMHQKNNRQIVKSAITEPVDELRKNAGRMRWKYYYHQCVRKYKNKKNVIMFMTEQGDKIGGNLKAVYKRMKERGLDKNYTIYFSARPASYIKQSRQSTKKLINKLAQCDMIFIDDHVPLFDWLKLNGRTKVIQLWHAGAGFKSSGYSRWGHMGCPAPVSCHRQYSYGIAGSRHIAPFFSEVFGINTEQILPTGMPRMDEYLDEKYRANMTKKLYQKYPMCKGKKVILFAPTYRGKNRKTAHYPYEMVDFKRLYEFCADEYVVMFKMHPWVASAVPIEDKYKDKFVDVNTYPNINDLLYITEILITDYSSNIFEYSLMRKPMLFFAFDKIQYSFSRGFHRDYEEAAPGKVCYTFEQLMEALEKKDYEYEKVEEYVEKHFDYIDTHASDRVIDWILLGNIPEDIQKAIDAKKDKVKETYELDFSVLKETEEQ